MTTITIPIDVAEAAAEALGNFVSDHGWSDSDMQAMDNLDSYIARHKAIRAELAKPVEPVEQSEPVAWMWQHEETGRTGFIETSLAKDWAKLNPRQPLVMPVYKHPPTPAWHDAPTEPGLWVLDDGTALVLESGTLPKAFDGLRWYGPIPQDGEKS